MLVQFSFPFSTSTSNGNAKRTKHKSSDSSDEDAHTADEEEEEESDSEDDVIVRRLCYTKDPNLVFLDKSYSLKDFHAALEGQQGVAPDAEGTGWHHSGTLIYLFSAYFVALFTPVLLPLLQ